MNKLTLLILTLISIQANAQFDITRLDKLYDGETIDTTITKNLILYDNYYPYYYSFDAKYPESSQTLLTNCQKFLSHKNIKLKGSGYLNFTFMIDNEGQMNYTKLSQLDENYNSTKFNQKGITAIYDYLKTLNKWGKVRYKGDEKIPISYISFMSFKIENAKITNIIP
jgi:hypothetical protein